MSAIFGETLTFQQGNGTDIELVVFGDEFYARYETKAGYSVVFDPDRESFCYAAVVEGRFASSGTPVFKPAPWGLKKHLKESEAVRNAKFEQRFARMAAPETGGDPLRLRTFGASQGLLPGRRVSQGNVLGLTLLVQFADVTTQVTREDVAAMLNSESFSRHGNYCSVKEYYRLMSGGKLIYANKVVGPITLSRKRAYYQNNLLVEEALRLAIEEHDVSLAEFDSQEAGVVDAINILYAGRTVYAGELWPHNWKIDLRFQGLRTHFYMLASLGRSPVDLSIGTFCHENGHQLCRFPDLYDYGQRDGDFEKSQGLGGYCLMGSGNHNNHGRTPSPICSYLRYLVGWYQEEVLLNAAQSYSVPHSAYATAFKYETDQPNEFFLLENRSQLGLDEYLPSSGLAVYHCDTLGSNEWQGGTADKHYQCGLLQADGHLDLENNRNRGDAGDLFGQRPGVALSDTTTPSSRMWDGSDSGLMIRDISRPGETMQFTTGEPRDVASVQAERKADLLIPDADPEGVESHLPIGPSGKLSQVAVQVHITHTYISDLQVELVAPSGRKAVLHDRSGGAEDDLVQTYTSVSQEALQELVGEEIAGQWGLRVRDLVGQDRGRLNSWSLDLAYEADGKEINLEMAPELEIPDNEPSGASSRIEVQEDGSLLEPAITVEIKHPFIGDLLVELAAPSGENAVLHSRSGGGKDNLSMSYDVHNTPALQTLVGVGIKGAWQLRVRDMARYDQGRLARWSLKLRYR